MTNKKVLRFIENTLNQLSLYNNFDISFKGSLDVVTHDWRRKNFGLEITPFVLSATMFEPNELNNTIDFRYNLYIMPFAKDRVKIEYLMDELDKELTKKVTIDGWNLNFRPVNITYGDDFSEGSGHGILRFETLYNFQGSATTNYVLSKDLELEIDGELVPVISLKWEHGKISYLNKVVEFEGDNQININKDNIILEVPLNPNNTILQDFITTKQRVNIEKEILMKLGNVEIVNNKYDYDGFTLSTGINNTSMSVFLYFSIVKDRDLIMLDDEEVPVLDFAIATKASTFTRDGLVDNISKSIYLGKATSYAFIISEEQRYNVIKKMMGDLISNEDAKPIYTLTIRLYGVDYVKTLLLDDIVKESKGTYNSTLKLVFLESGELDG